MSLRTKGKREMFKPLSPEYLRAPTVTVTGRELLDAYT